MLQTFKIFTPKNKILWETFREHKTGVLKFVLNTLRYYLLFEIFIIIVTVLPLIGLIASGGNDILFWAGVLMYSIVIIGAFGFLCYQISEKFVEHVDLKESEFKTQFLTTYLTKILGHNGLTLTKTIYSDVLINSNDFAVVDKNEQFLGILMAHKKVWLLNIYDYNFSGRSEDNFILMDRPTINMKILTNMALNTQKLNKLDAHTGYQTNYRTLFLQQPFDELYTAGQYGLTADCVYLLTLRLVHHSKWGEFKDWPQEWLEAHLQNVNVEA